MGCENLPRYHARWVGRDINWSGEINGTVTLTAATDEDDPLAALIAKQENRVVTPPAKIGPINWRPFIAAFHRLAPKLWRAYANVIDGTLRLRLVGDGRTLEARIYDCDGDGQIGVQIGCMSMGLTDGVVRTPEQWIESVIGDMMGFHTRVERAGIQRMKSATAAEATDYLKARAEAADQQAMKRFEVWIDLYREDKAIFRECFVVYAIDSNKMECHDLARAEANKKYPGATILGSSSFQRDEATKPKFKAGDRVTFFDTVAGGEIVEIDGAFAKVQWDDRAKGELVQHFLEQLRPEPPKSAENGTCIITTA